MSPDERRIRTLAHALCRLDSSEEFCHVASPEATLAFLRESMEASGARRDMLSRTPYETDRQTLETVFDADELQALVFSMFGVDQGEVYRKVFLGETTIVRETVMAYTLYTDTLRYSGIYPDPRARLRRVLSRLIHGQTLHLSDPFPPLQMDRTQAARRAVLDAFVKGRLIPGRYTTCALQAILSQTTNDMGWIPAFQSFTTGVALREEVPPFSYYAALAGFSPEELVQIEEAFESRGYVVTPEGRLLAVLDTLDTIEAA